MGEILTSILQDQKKACVQKGLMSMQSEKRKMTLFNELQTLDSISNEAFQVFGMVKSYEQRGEDILIVCSTSRVADTLFKNYARDRLGNKMNTGGRWIAIEPNKGKIYFKSLSSLRTWLPGHRFKKI